MSEQKTLAAKMSAIMGEVPTMIKNGRNQQQNYDFVSVEDIKAVLRPLLHKYHIALFSNVMSVDRTSHTVTKTYGKDTKESTVITVLAHMKFVLVDGETGDTMEHFWVGEATDYGDKALNKAATAGLKYWLNSTFLLSTTEPDADEETIIYQPATLSNAFVPATKEQRYSIGSLFAQAGLGKPSEVPDWLAEKGYDSKLLSANDAKQVIDLLTDQIQREPTPDM